METNLVRGESSRQSKERRASLDRKPQAKAIESISEVLSELAQFKVQSRDFFVTERGLCGKGLNPKLASDMAIVTPEKLEEVWGKCSTFKTTNTTLKPHSRKALLDLHAKIYGKREVTNNEMSGWLVKGYIAELMGFQVDWASAATSTAFVLGSRLEGDLLRCELTPEDAATLQALAPHVTPKPGGCSKVGGLGTTMDDSKLNLSPFQVLAVVSAAGIANAEEVLKVEEELLSNSEEKERFLQTSKKNMEEKIIGFKFGVDDRQADAKEAAENVKEVEEALSKIHLNIGEVEATIQHFRDTLDEGNDGFSLGLTKLGNFRAERDALIRKLEFANFSLEDTLKRAKKAQDQYEDAGLDLWKSEANIEVVRRELQEVRRHRDTVSNQIQKMKHGGGVVCCPKPCLHPDQPEEVHGSFELEPCSFCNRWYNSYDVVMASCKHFYHPFCITKLVDFQNSCVTCKETFHPSWWKSFGFRPVQSNVEDAAAKVSYDKSIGELSDTVKDNFRIPIPEWSQSRGKFSDWGSSGSIYQAQQILPCTSGSKLVNLAPATNGRGELPEVPMLRVNFDSTQEVDSPPKDLLTNKHTIQSNVANEDTVLNAMDINASMFQYVNLGAKQSGNDALIGAEQENKEALGAGEALDNAKENNDAMETSAQEGGGRYSVTLKRALNPDVDDLGVRKKVSIANLSMESGDIERSDKAPVPVPRKHNTRMQQSRKADADASEKGRKPGRSTRGKNK